MGDPGDMGAATLTALVASVLMLLAMMRKRHVAWKHVQCPVCHNDRAFCTCRWL